jgi:hypothetical protein
MEEKLQYFSIEKFECSKFIPFPPSWKWRPYWIFQSGSIANIEAYTSKNLCGKFHAFLINWAILPKICTNQLDYSLSLSICEAYIVYTCIVHTPRKFAVLTFGLWLHFTHVNFAILYLFNIDGQYIANIVLCYLWWLICANLRFVVFSFCRGKKTNDNYRLFAPKRRQIDKTTKRKVDKTTK